MQRIFLIALVVLMAAATAFAAEKPAIEVGFGTYASQGQGTGSVLSVKGTIPKTNLTVLYMHVGSLGKTEEYDMRWGTEPPVTTKGWFTTQSRFDFVGLGLEKTSGRLTYGVNVGPAWVHQSFQSKAQTPEGGVVSFMKFHDDTTRLGVHAGVGYQLSENWSITAGYMWPGESELQGWDLQFAGRKAF